jgi:hypothetical protein
VQAPESPAVAKVAKIAAKIRYAETILNDCIVYLIKVIDAFENGLFESSTISVIGLTVEAGMIELMFADVLNWIQSLSLIYTFMMGR